MYDVFFVELWDHDCRHDNDLIFTLHSKTVAEATFAGLKALSRAGLLPHITIVLIRVPRAHPDDDSQDEIEIARCLPRPEKVVA